MSECRSLARLIILIEHEIVLVAVPAMAAEESSESLFLSLISYIDGHGNALKTQPFARNDLS